MNQAIFIPLSDEALEQVLQEEAPQLIPYAYQQSCYHALLEDSTEARAVPVSTGMTDS